MGDPKQPGGDEGAVSDFTRALLDDVVALERMLASADLFETGKRRVGAEQEMFLVDASMRPAPVAMQILERAGDPRLTTELALFNLEANVSPRVFGGRCLSEMHAELEDVVGISRAAAAEVDAHVLLAGILPTLRKEDLGLQNMTPKPRYRQLNDTLARSRGGAFQVLIKGTDELQISHDNVMLEACNTSFQVHFQVAPSEFAKLYNVAQAATAPVLAAAVNSPLLLGHRLWHETRVALFQWAVDSRSAAHQARGHRPRVTFGDDWVRASVLEVFREQIARFRVVLPGDREEDPLAVLAAGGVPSLAALRFHNGTVYRWNRACYGISEGKPHLRIENRVLPAGPTIADEMANAAFFFGLMSGVLEEHGDPSGVMAFADAKANFVAAARRGLEAQLTWLDGKTWPVAELVTERLLPLAREGLQASGVDDGDARSYLEIVGRRVEKRQTGARWVLRSLAEMAGSGTQDARERTLVATMLERQRTGEPISEWLPCALVPGRDFRESYRTVGRIMSRDLFTVQADDILDLAATVMDWEHVRYMPVEDDQGRLLGILSHRTLLRALGRRTEEERRGLRVRDVMKTELVTVGPDTPTLVAIRLMRDHRVGSLPVVEDGKLVGIVTEGDLIELSSSLLEKYLSEP